MFQICWNWTNTVSLKMGRQHRRGRTSVSKSCASCPTHMRVTQADISCKTSGNIRIGRYKNLANIFTLSDPRIFMNIESDCIVPTR